MRAWIVLACAGEDVAPILTVAKPIGVAPDTVRTWRRRFLACRLDGLVDEPRPDWPHPVSLDQVEDVVVATMEQTPPNATYWSRTSMAYRSGLSKSTIGRIWRRFDLKSHLGDEFKISTDPLFVDKTVDIVGLYFDPPEGAIVLCVDEKADEKSELQALTRSAPVLPMMPGVPERRTHDYVRHGVTSLFAAFDVGTGQDITALHRRHRAVEPWQLLAMVDASLNDAVSISLPSCWRRCSGGPDSRCRRGRRC